MSGGEQEPDEHRSERAQEPDGAADGERHLRLAELMRSGGDAGRGDEHELHPEGDLVSGPAGRVDLDHVPDARHDCDRVGRPRNPAEALCDKFCLSGKLRWIWGTRPIITIWPPTHTDAASTWRNRRTVSTLGESTHTFYRSDGTNSKCHMLGKPSSTNT